jgi:methionyl-tRNA synthetase
MYICGSDDHGVAIMITAEKEGKTPLEIATHYNQNHQRDFKAMGIHFDIYGRTCNNQLHNQLSQDFFKALYDKGYFSKQSSKQFFDTTRNAFLPDRYVKGTCSFCNAKDQNSDQCEECGKMLDTETLIEPYSVISKQKAEIKDTVHWFLNLASFENEVATWLKNADLRDNTRKYVEGLISTGLVTRSMTRDLEWGIPVPLAEEDAKNKVLYVWFDAPVGYVSNTSTALIEAGKPADSYKEWWQSSDCEIAHFIGEDNTIFHCLIWIAMLSAEGHYQLPKKVIVNQFVNFQKPGSEVEKMSKSRGSAVFINDFIAEGNNPDMLRYYLTSIAPERARSVFNPQDLIQRNNSDLANTLGNFVNRILSFNLKYVGAQMPDYDQNLLTATDTDFTNSLTEAFNKIDHELYNCNFKSALEHLMEAVRSANKYVDLKAPWTTRKTDMEATKVTLALTINAIKFFTITMEPFLPFTAEKLQRMLNLNREQSKWDQALNPIAAGNPLGEIEILFEKIEI